MFAHGKPLGGGGFFAGQQVAAWQPKERSTKSFYDFSQHYRMSDKKSGSNSYAYKFDEMEENEDPSARESCYFKENKHLADIQKTTAIASKVSLLVALKRWKKKTHNIYRVKGYCNQYKLHLHIKKAQNTIKPRETHLQFFVKIRVAQYRTETTPLSANTAFSVPYWDEEFDFYLDSLHYPLELKIVERDKFGDHFVGRCSTDLYEFDVSQPCAVVKPLEDKRGVATKLNGQLEFVILLEATTDSTTTTTQKDDIEGSMNNNPVGLPLTYLPSDESEYSNHSPFDIVDYPDIDREHGQPPPATEYGAPPSAVYRPPSTNGTASSSSSKRDEIQSSSSSRDTMSHSSRDLSSSRDKRLGLPSSDEGDKPPYRKMSLTPNLPRLEQRTSLHERPLQKQQTHKMPTSDDSGSDAISPHKRRITQPPAGFPKVPDIQFPSQNLQETRSCTGSQSSNDHSPRGAAKYGSAPSLRHIDSVKPQEALIPSVETSITRRVSPPNEEQDTATDVTMADKRKTFAQKNIKRKTGMLTPNSLTDIGERSDNSDQSFDHADHQPASTSGSVEGMFPSSPKEDTTSEIYVLRFTVQSATDVPLTECYVKVKVGSIHKKTPIAKEKDGYTWNSTLEFYVTNTELTANVQVCDKDAFRDIYGQATLDLSSLQLDIQKSHKLRLRGPNGGKLQTSMLIITLLEKTDKQTATKLMKKRAKSFCKKDFKRGLWRAKSSISTIKQKSLDAYSSRSNLKPNTLAISNGTFDTSDGSCSRDNVSTSKTESTVANGTTSDKDAPKFRLHVEFYEAGNISGKGSKQTFDTYVKLRINDTEFKTSVIKKTANPKFNETFEFDLHDIIDPLKIKIFQVSRLFDDFLGNCTIRLSGLPFDTDLNINEYPVITDEARFKCFNAHISLGLRLSCLASKVTQKTTTDNKGDHKSPTDVEPSAFRVYINMFRGRDLLACDDTGTSDPYVLLRIGSTQHRTNVIYHSLAPMWNDNFMFSINSLKKDLHITVVDEDPEFDDLMARFRLKLNSIPLQIRCEFEIDLDDDSGTIEFSMLIQKAEDPVISKIPYMSYSDTPIAQLSIKPIGLAQSEKNSSRLNYRLEVCVGKERFSIFYEGPGQAACSSIDIYDAYLESVKFNLYMVKFGLQEKLMATIEEDVANQGSAASTHVTMDLPDISNMFLLSFNLNYKSYETGACLVPVEYDEEKSFEEMTFDELGDALSCPYNYALCVDAVVVEKHGVFGDDQLVAVIETDRIILKSTPSDTISDNDDNDIHCGFIFRLESMPRTLTLRLFKRKNNFSTYLGTTDFNITKSSDGVLKSEMVLETDSSIIPVAILYDVIQHLHQDIINTMTVPSIVALRPDADELVLMNNFKTLTYCFVTLQVFLKYTTSIRRMGTYKKLFLLLLSLVCLLNTPKMYTQLTLPVALAIFLLGVSFRIVWKRKHLTEMRSALLEEINTCNVDETIFVRTCDKTVTQINKTLQKIIYVFSWSSPVNSTIFLVKLLALSSLFVLLPEQLLFLAILLVLLAPRTSFENTINELLDFLNPLNGIPANICS